MYLYTTRGIRIPNSTYYCYSRFFGHDGWRRRKAYILWCFIFKKRGIDFTMSETKNNDAMTTKAPTTNGSNAESNSSSSSSSSCSSSSRILSSFSIVTCVLVALISLFVGILTPPLYERLNHEVLLQQSDDRSLLSYTQGSVARHIDCNREENFDGLLHEVPIFGYHVVCIQGTYSNDGSSQQKLVHIDVTMYRYGQEKRMNEHYVSTVRLFASDDPNDLISWNSIKNAFVENLKLTPADDMHQPWSIFSTVGEYVIGENSDIDQRHSSNDILHSFLHHGIFLVYQGGQFIWPGVRVGYERTVELYSIMPPGSPSFDENMKRNVTIQTLSIRPLVLSVNGFLSESECDHIQTMAQPTMEYSGVVLMDKDAGRAASDFRTSQTTFLHATHDTILKDIDYRTASLVRVPRVHQEPVQVLRYGVTEKYQSHTDFFDPVHYQKDKNTLNLIQNGRRNRMITVFWYLSTVEEGGETVFPRMDGRRELSFDDCSGGLLVKPEKGKVIIFYSLKYDGKTDYQSLHGACPVKEGVKWAANKWVWNEPMAYVGP